MRAWLQSLPDKIDCPKLDKDESIKEHNVNDSALLILKKPLLAKYMNPDSPDAFFHVIIELGFLAELDVFDPSLDHINKQTDSVSGYKQERDKIDPKQSFHKCLTPFDAGFLDENF